MPDASLSFLTPLGALVALATLVPVLAVLLVRRRARILRRALDLDEPRRRRIAVALSSVVIAGALVGLAAAQPILERPVSRIVRTDTEVFVVLDVSRSMLAQDSVTSPTRMERAKAAASAIRVALPTVEVGIASLSDRVLPHLFPSADANLFEATLERAIDVERPPPRASYQGKVTKLDALAAVRGFRLFSPTAKRRVVVVLTDGESLPVATARLGDVMLRIPKIDLVLVQVWGADEHVFTNGVPEPRYEPDPSARELLDQIAAAAGGSAHSEADLEGATRRIAALVGDGPTVVEGEVGDRIALAPYLAAAAFLPLALFLRRRER